MSADIQSGLRRASVATCHQRHPWRAWHPWRHLADLMAFGAESVLRRPVGAVYVVLAMVAAAVSQTWFSAGRFIAAGDVGPFVRDGPATELAWLWNHQMSGAGTASTEVARAFEVGVSVAVTAAGFGDVHAQRVLYAVVLMGMTLGTAWFAAAFTRRPAIIGLAGLLGVLNPLVLVANFNPVLLAPIGVLGGLAGCVLRAANNRRVTPAIFGLMSVTVSYLGLNPPTLAVAVVSVVGLALLGSQLAGSGGTRRALLLLLRSTPWVIAFNLWWIVPYVAALIGSRGDVAAVTDITAWAWTHANNDLWNVAALTAHWAWGQDSYLPIAATLDEAPWVWLRYFLPGIALTTPLVAVRRYRRLSLTVGGCALALIFVGKGVHAPLGEVNVWMYERLPGFWLLREPLNKVGPVLLLCYVLLLVVWLESVPTRLALWGQRWLRTIPALIAVLMLTSSWPVFTGDLIPVDRGELPSARVALPQAWRSVAETVNAAGGTGKALVLPLNTYYQVETTWGYHGADSIVTWLLERPVLQLLPGGYVGEDVQYEQLLLAVEQALAAKRSDAAVRMMQSLGVSHLIVRRDLAPDRSGQAVASPEELLRAASGAPGLALAQQTAVADVFTVGGARGGTFAAYGSMVSGRSDDVSATVEVLPPSTALVGAQNAQLGVGTVAALTQDTGTVGKKFEIALAGTYEVAAVGSSWWRVVHDNRSVNLEPQDVITVDGVEVARRRSIELDVGVGGYVAVPATGEVLNDGELVSMEDGTRLIGLAIGDSHRPALDPEVGDCNMADDRTPAETGVGGFVKNGLVSLRAAAHRACLRVPLKVDVATPFILRMDMRSLGGAPARACIWEIGPNTCAPIELSSDRKEWTRQDVVVQVDPATTAVELYLYADGLDDGRTTRTEYRDIELTPLERRTEAKVRPPSSQRIRLEAGVHDMKSTRPESKNRLGALSSLRSCGGKATDDSAAEPIPGGFRLRATDHVACVVAPVRGSKAESFVVELEYRSLGGHSARICLWQVGPNTCAAMPQLNLDQGWHRLRTTVHVDPNARGLELYLYADGYGNGTTVTEYRDVGVVEAVPQRTSVRPADMKPPPKLVAQRQNPASYTVEVGDATDDFVVGFADSFAPGWTLRGLPQGWSATHVELDGYANGWAVRKISARAPSRLHLTVEHRPSVLMRLLLVLPVGAVLALILVSRRRRHGPAGRENPCAS